MTKALLVCLLAAFAGLAACGDSEEEAPDAAVFDGGDAAQCGARPGFCDDVGDLTGCGVTLCGAWERCECAQDDQTGEWDWQVEYVDCLCAVDGGV